MTTDTEVPTVTDGEAFVSVDSYEHRMRYVLGLGEPGTEGQVFHDRETGLVRIVNFGKEVWRSSLTVPTTDKRNHSSLIAMLVDAGFKTKGFRNGFMREFFGLTGTPCRKSHCTCKPTTEGWFAVDEDFPNAGCHWAQARDYEDFWETFSMIPDAWLVLPEHDVLVVAEVDVTHHHDPDRYLDMWWWLDCESWSLCTVHVDRHGNACSPHDFARMYLHKAAGDRFEDPSPPTTAAAPKQATHATAKASGGSIDGTWVWRGKRRPL